MCIFYRSEVFNEEINDWDVSNVENMSQMFSHENILNGNLNEWKNIR